jgi:cytochrome c oxidase subunit 2
MKWMTFISMVWASVAQANTKTSFMPPAATEIAGQVDNLYAFLLWASLIACVILIGGMIFFAMKYRRKSANDKTAYITHNTFLEFLWSFIPLVIFLFVFGWGWYIYHQMRAMPKEALEVHVYGKQWAWEFVYKSGKASTNEFVVPVNTPVKLIMTSKDVLHSFYIPSMRIKQDVVPGKYSALWFESEKLGDFHVFCTEFCGAAHSLMLGRMKVVSQADYEAWLQENDEGLTLVQRGAKLHNDKGCVACHSVDGSVKVGPTWKGIWGATHQFVDGGSALVDEAYIRESILEPNKHIVKGYPAAMPSYQGQLTEEQLNAMIEYIKTLK